MGGEALQTKERFHHLSYVVLYYHIVKAINKSVHRGSIVGVQPILTDSSRAKRMAAPDPGLYADAVSVAAQTGRLDLVTSALAILAAMVGLAGLYAFFDVRRIAAAVARRASDDTAAAVAEAVAVKYLERELPKLWDAYRELASNGVADAEANAIAQAQEGGE